jgi:DNA repair protein SbcC/Rad50
MIRRFTKLDIQDFRIFAGRVSVPLDADVVVIYGPNGSGKTGLISALEYAITGRVEDLQGFSDDYPRCLRSIWAAGEPRATLQFESTAGDDLQVSTPVNAGQGTPGKLTTISDEDRRFFVERCYISQRQLGRLLEIYQSPDKQQKEQPLVRFVRELLALDLLENLTGGTHEAGNIVRLQKASPALATLRGEEASMPGQRAQIDGQREERLRVLEESCKAIDALVSRIGDQSPAGGWTPASIRARIIDLESARLGENLSSTLRRLQESQGRLHSAIGLLQASSEVITQDAISLQAKLKALEKDAIHEKLDLLRREAELVFASVGLSGTLPAIPDAGRQLEAVEDDIANNIARLDADILTVNETNQEIRQLELRASQLEETTRKGSGPSARRPQKQRRLIELLQGVLDHLDSEVCPVCARDYSEIGRGPLKSRILEELQKLGQDTERLELAAKQRAQLESELSDVEHRIVALRTVAQQSDGGLEAIQSRRATLARLKDRLAGERPVRDEWRRTQQEEAVIREELRMLEERISQQETSRLQISQLADDLGIPQETRPTTIERLADTVANDLRARIEDLEKRRGSIDELLAALVAAERTAAELAKIEGQARDLSEKEERIQGARIRIDQYIEKTRKVARAANTAKERLLKEVFNDTLNALWEDLFERLVKSETFVPRLREPTVWRGQIKAAIQAIAAGTNPFEQAGSVLSAGNLNTAAVSLFLSLNLVQSPRHRVIVLDDPVQSMDDIHVTQLADLLRAITRQAGRQLVLTVHERSLYEYLCLELGPTRESDSLLAIEVVRSDSGHGSTIHPERRTWKPDLVSFGPPLEPHSVRG